MAKAKNPIPETANKKKKLSKEKQHQLDNLKLLIERCEAYGHKERAEHYKELLKDYK
jgi:hypothetical protein